MKASNKRQLNVNLPEELNKDLEHYARDSGYNKTEVVKAALSHYLTIKHEESDFKASYPDRRIKSRVVLEVMPREDEEPRMASVLMY